MPEISSLLSIYFSEIQTIGLLASFYVGSPGRDSFLKLVPDRLTPFIALYKVAEDYCEAKLSFRSTPILYNNGNWVSDEILGGYSDPKVDIKASQLSSSYFACWNFVGCYSRLVKATLWYIKSTGNFMDGFNYLTDLFEAGYIINPDELTAAGNILAEIKCKLAKPLKVINSLPLDTDSATTPLMLKHIQKSLKGHNVNQGDITEIYSWLLKKILDQISLARKSPSIGDFLICAAKISGFYKLLLSLTRGYKKSLGLTLQDEAIISHIEEINADFGSSKIMFYAAPRHLPLVNDPLGNMLSGQSLLAIMVGMEYREKFKDDAAEKLIEDRLLVPDYLKPTFRQIFGKSKLKNKSEAFKIPDDWNYFPLTFSFIFGIIKNIEPSLMRSKLLAKELILKEIQNLYAKYKFSDTEIGEIIADQYSYIDMTSRDDTQKKKSVNEKRTTSELAKQYIIEHFYEIYHDLCIKEQEQQFLPLILESDKFTEKRQFLNRRSQLLRLSKIYPWQASIYHEISIDSDNLADEKEATKNIKRALQLDPENQFFWQSMGTICSKYGTKKDALFADAIRYSLQNTPSQDQQSSKKPSSGGIK